VGGKGPRLYKGIPRIAGDHQFHRDFLGASAKRLQVTSEGTQLQFGQIRYRLELFIQGKAPDGMDIDRYYNFDWVDSKDAPDDKAVYAAEATMRKELEGLVAAPINDPTVGPALLTGRAAAVFFHEVFGHRAEGHRQKDVTEGQTFSKKSGRADPAGFSEHHRRHDHEKSSESRTFWATTSSMMKACQRRA